ncbi:MAG: alpha/beta hydrolase [Deltaproteobacteria bacterium]|nr:alpha/beta hydrolase [Deltaproteobacteria bacterium]
MAKDGEFVKLGTVKVHYIRKGRGRPLILIHGIFSSSFVWHKNIEDLSNFFDVIALDLKGYGYSDKPADGKYSREDFRQFLIGFMDAIQVKKATIVGHSWGGGLAIDFSTRFPQRTEKVVLINSVGYPFKSSPAGWFINVPGAAKLLLGFANAKTFEKILKKYIFFNPQLVTKEEVEGWVRPYFVKGAAHAALQLRTYDFDMTQSIRTMTHPTLIIWGREDRCLPLKLAERFKQDIRNSSLKIIPNSGHNPQEEQPTKVKDLIVEFVKTDKGS